MALSTLTLSVTAGVQGRPFEAAISGQTTGNLLFVERGYSPGFSIVNARLMSSGLPYQVSTVAIRERNPSTGETLVSVIDITAYTRDQLKSQAAAAVPSYASFSIVGTYQSNGTWAYDLRIKDALGATTVQSAAGGGSGPSLALLPQVLLVGASTTRMNSYGDVSPQRGGPMAGSPVSWYQMLYGRRLMFENQPNLGANNPDHTYQRGYDYAADGARSTDETSHAPSFDHQLDAAIWDWSTTSTKPYMVIVSERNDVDGSFTSAQYIAAMQALYAKALAAGFKVIATELWNPMLTDTSAAYTGASAPGRQVTIDFNTWINANWQSLGISALVPLFAAMTDTGTAGNPPKTGYTADTRHFSSKGGKAGAAAYATVFNAIAQQRVFPAADAGNIFGAFTASGGTANTGVTGTLSSNVQATRSAQSTATVAASTGSDAGGAYQRLTIAATTGVTAPGETTTLEPITMPTPAAGVTHAFRQRVRIKATNVPYSIYATMQDDGAAQARVNAITPITNVSGNTPVSAPAANIQWFDGSTDLDLWIESPAIAWSGAGTAHWKLSVLYASSGSDADQLVVDVFPPITFAKSNQLTPAPRLFDNMYPNRGQASVASRFADTGEGYASLNSGAVTCQSNGTAYFTTAGLMASKWVPSGTTPANYDVIAEYVFPSDVAAQNIYTNGRIQDLNNFVSAGRFGGKWAIVINAAGSSYFYPTSNAGAQADLIGAATPTPAANDRWRLRLNCNGNTFTLFVSINGGPETQVATITNPLGMSSVAAAGSVGFRNSGTLGSSTTGAQLDKFYAAGI